MGIAADRLERAFRVEIRDEKFHSPILNGLVSIDQIPELGK
jgi:hypothetical protein